MGKQAYHFFMKTTKNIFSYGVSQYGKSSGYTMPFNVFQILEWVFNYQKIWNKIQSQLREKLTTKPIKVECNYMRSKLSNAQ